MKCKHSFMLLFSLGFVSCTSAQTSIVKIDSFYSLSVQLQLKYTAILPANYYNSKKTFPVVYLLHGHTGNYTSWISYAQLPTQLPTQYNCIIILPDGGNSWYVNWSGQTDGKLHKWEDMLVKDLLPAVDKKWRTFADKKGRTIGGLSMGGYGALAVGLKNTNLFGFVFSIAGAINFCENIKDEIKRDTIDWNSPMLWSGGDKVIAATNFSTQLQRTPQGKVFITTEQADVYNPYILLQNADSASLPFIHITCGLSDELLKDARQFSMALQRKTKNYSYIEMPGEHEVPFWSQAMEHVFLVMKHNKFF